MEKKQTELTQKGMNISVHFQDLQMVHLTYICEHKQQSEKKVNKQKKT